VSLHSLGGEIRKEREPSSFVFRDRGVLLQYQAWWQPDAPELDDRCIAWVENVRDTMKPRTDGAFINFRRCHDPARRLLQEHRQAGRDAVPAEGEEGLE